MRSRSRKSVVVLDTNVALVAARAFERDAESVPAGLKSWCADMLASVMSGNRKIAVDQGGEIIQEYQNKLPGTQLGAAFIKWLWLNMWNAENADRISIHRAGQTYVEFPVDPKLSDFDVSDRKFVAVANAHPGRPHIQEAADGKWLRWSKSLLRHGIVVDFGDLEFVRVLCKKKNGCKGSCSRCDG